MERIDATHLVVAVRARAKEGEANRAIERALAEYFDVAISCVRMIKGHTSREKVVEVLQGSTS